MLDTKSSESKLKVLNVIYLTCRLSFSLIYYQSWFVNFTAVYFLYQLT